MKKLEAVYALRRNGYSGPFFVGLSLLSMGVWVLATPRVFQSSPVYRIMDDVASEATWGLFLIVTSLLLLASSINKRPRDVAAGSLIAAFGFFIILSSAIAGNERSMFIPLLFVMTLRCLALNREFIARHRGTINPSGHEGD